MLGRRRCGLGARGRLLFTIDTAAASAAGTAAAACATTAPLTLGARGGGTFVRLGKRRERGLRRGAFDLGAERDFVLPVVEPGQRNEATARGFTWVDIGPASTSNIGSKGWIASDQLHPGDAQYAAWADAIWSVWLKP